MAKNYSAPITEVIRFNTERLCGLLDGSDLNGGGKNGGMSAPQRKIF